jgi:hypothetical protein
MADDKVTEEIRKLLGELKCPKSFICYTSGFKTLCKAEDVGMESYLKCLEEDPKVCVFSIGYGDAYYCKCPLRVYIAKTLCK